MDDKIEPITQISWGKAYPGRESSNCKGLDVEMSMEGQCAQSMEKAKSVKRHVQPDCAELYSP